VPALAQRQTFLNPQNLILAVLLLLYCTGVYSLAIGLIVFSVFAYLYLLKNEFRISLVSLFLFSFSITYAVASYTHGVISAPAALLFAVLPVALYFTGEYAIRKEARDKLAFFYVYLVLVSFFLVGIYSIWKTIQYGGFTGLFLDVRLVYMPGSDVWVNATNLGAYFAMGLSLLGYIITAGSKSGSAVRLLSILIFGLSAVSMLFLGNRTGLVIAFVSFCAVYIVTMFYGGQKLSNNVKTNAMLILAVLAAIFIVQLFGLGEMLLGTTLVQRFPGGGFFEDPRFEAWPVALRGLFEYPLGGKQADIPLTFAHNLWLDVGYVAGVIPFILLLAFSWLILRNLLRLIKTKACPIGLKALFTGVYVALLLNFFVEPVLEGYFIHFTILCFIAGVTSKYIRLEQAGCSEEARR